MEGSTGQLEAKGEMDALILFKGYLATYVRAYEFLGQIFDCGDTALEQLYLFKKGFSHS